MAQVTKKTDDFANKKYYFASFESKYDFENAGKSAYAKLKASSPKNKIINYWENAEIDPDFVGSSDKKELEEGNFIEYINRPALDTTLESFDELFSKIDMGGAFEKSRIIITEDKRGIFDFSLASKGLYRPQEYFSQELADDLPYEFPMFYSGLVPFDNVYIDKMNQFWYTSKDNSKTYSLTKQQDGTRAIELKIPNARLKFRTKTKKAYVMFQKKGGKAKFCDLYVGIGGLAGLTYEGMLAKVLPLLLVARYLETGGIKTRINAMRVYEDDDEIYCFTYPIKNFGEDLDFNWIAINTADPRWFRWNIWKYLAAISKERFNTSTLGYGRTLYGGPELIETFNRFKNWKLEETEKGKFQDLGIDYNLMITGGLKSPTNSISDQKTEIEEEFFRILDVVDFQFNDAKKAAKRTYDRLDEKGYTNSSAKEQIIKSLSNAYSYPQKGSYATPSKRQDKISEDFNKAFDGTVEFFNTLN
jgi:hypothetical protein